ncbi:MAG: TonB-dependent receptor domain-containing protein [Bryobacteraceae bacterium]
MTLSNLTRVQFNLTPANILTASLLYNYIDADRTGLSFLEPAETTVNRRQNLYFTSIRDQWFFGRGTLVELGFADSRGLTRESPQGAEPYEILPSGRRGNFFVDLTRHISRQQWIGSASLPAAHSHQWQFGVDLQRTAFDHRAVRHEYRVFRADHSLARQVQFAGEGQPSRTNFESALYAQDRWTLREGLLLEAGLRFDWDQVVREVLVSPRLSAVWAPKVLPDTKFAAGIGVFHDALSLGAISRHLDQSSFATFYRPDGSIARGPVETAFFVDEQGLRVPRYRTVSFSVEKKLPFDLYGKAGYSRRSGRRGLSFYREFDPFSGGLYHLLNGRNDRYDAFELAVRRAFGGRFEWSAGYTASSARSDAVVDYSLENPVFAEQGPGPFPWDTPHRFLTWGWAPVPRALLPRSLEFLARETSVAYLVEAHTGFPFGVVDEEGFQVGRPNERRLPSYFNINLHFERRFRFLDYLWAWRFGVNNLTNSGNPNVVNNNIDSPFFLAYGRGQQRAVNVRLRFLGRK